MNYEERELSGKVWHEGVIKEALSEDTKCYSADSIKKYWKHCDAEKYIASVTFKSDGTDTETNSFSALQSIETYVHAAECPEKNRFFSRNSSVPR